MNLRTKLSLYETASECGCWMLVTGNEVRIPQQHTDEQYEKICDTLERKGLAIKSIKFSEMHNGKVTRLIVTNN